MASAQRRAPYPWGTIAPRQRLRLVSASARKALDSAKSPGFGRVSDSVSGAVRSTRALVDALRYLSGAGLRSSPDGDALAADDVRTAVDRVDRSVSDLAAASVLELSDRYRAFSEAVNALLEVADASSRQGIACPLDDGADGWATFER